jgi:hypothetical protein
VEIIPGKERPIEKKRERFATAAYQANVSPHWER